MKIFLAEFAGQYLKGEMIVVDETKRKAFNKAKKKIEDIGLLEKNQDFSTGDLTEIDYLNKQCIVVDNGDY